MLGALPEVKIDSEFAKNVRVALAECVTMTQLN